MDWRRGEVRELALDEFDQRFGRYRSQVDGPTRQAMIASLRRFGQPSPVVVCQLGGSAVLIDGFKRHEAAGETKGIDCLSARRIEADEASAKAAMYGLNCLVHRMDELEEAWIVYALVREDGLTQVQAAQLLGRHKSWACRRLAMLEKLSTEVRSDLALGLVSASVARQLVRLPVGNQAEALATMRREGLMVAQLRDMVDLILAAKSCEQVEFVLESGLGKSHIIQSVGRRACVAGYRVRYTTSAQLLGELGASLADGTTPRKIRHYARFDLLIIDEFGFDKLERDEFPQAPGLLYKVIDARTRQCSTTLVLNIDFDAWGDYLGDAPLVMALLDRLVDGALILKFRGQSYRAHRAKKPAAAK